MTLASENLISINKNDYLKEMFKEFSENFDFTNRPKEFIEKEFYASCTRKGFFPTWGLTMIMEQIDENKFCEYCKDRVGTHFFEGYLFGCLKIK